MIYNTLFIADHDIRSNTSVYCVEADSLDLFPCWYILPRKIHVQFIRWRGWYHIGSLAW